MSIKEEMLTLIKEDSEIGEAIINVVRRDGLDSALDDNDGSAKGLKAEIEQLNKKLALSQKNLEIKLNECKNAEKKLLDAQSEIKKKKDYIERLTKERDSKIKLCDQIQKELNEYIRCYGDALSLFKKFSNLSEAVRERISTLVSPESPIDLIVFSAVPQNIDLLFERIKLEWQNMKSDELDELCAVFDKMFEVMCRYHSGYARLTAVVGEEFLVSKHARTSDSSPQGKISRVIVNGYINTVTGKEVKPYVIVK